ncbi:MAG: manno-octulosonate cytidylyltransferase [Pseudomonadota bacterium]
MKSVIVIPARYASSRFPGKPLAPLVGATGVAKSLIERSWEAAQAVSGVDRIVVATDDGRIREAALAFGAEVVMTAETCANGTERCADALKSLGEPELVVNLQGDAPLTPPWFIEALIEEVASNPDVAVATPVLRCDREAYESFKSDRAAGRVGGTTAVFSQTGRALYFSKEVIPFVSQPFDAGSCPVFHHVGVYAYRPAALAEYVVMGETQLEREEGLEQLRFLAHDNPVHCVPVDARGASFWELNNPEDTPRIEAVLKARGMV